MNILDTLRRYWLEAAAVALLIIVLALALAMCGDTPSPTDRAQAVLDSTATARQDSTDAALDSVTAPVVIDSTVSPEDAICIAYPHTCR